MNDDLKIFAEQVRAAGSIAVMAHKNLDGDALCSMLAMARLIEMNFGRTATVVYDGNIPDCLDYVPLRDRVVHITKLPDDAAFDLIIALDYGAAAHIGGGTQLLGRAKFVIEIDHHKNDAKVGNLCIDDDTAAATAEIIYRMIRDARWDYDLDVATLIMTAIVTDTGNFKFARSGAVMRIAGDLIDYGVNIRRVMDGLNNKPRKSVLAEAAVVARAEFFYKGRLAVATVTPEEYRNIDGRGEIILNLLGQIKGTEYVALMKQQKENQTGLSLRSRHNPVNHIAEAFGGGGHERAAGAVVQDRIENVRSRVIQLFKGV